LNRKIFYQTYQALFSGRLDEITLLLKMRPSNLAFQREDFEVKRKKSLISLYNLNLKILKVFDENEKRPFLCN